MSNLRTTLHVLHAFAMALWLGCLVMTAVSAAILFPTMKSLGPTVAAYAAYDGPHHVIVAGHAAEKIFVACDLIQFVCAVLAVVSASCTALFFGPLGSARATMLRSLFLAAALSALAFHLLVLAPRMNTALRGYWAAAQAGKNEQAATLRDAFNQDHPTSRTVMAITAAAVAAGLAMALTPAGAGQSASGPARARSEGRREGEVPLEEPALLSKGKS